MTGRPDSNSAPSIISSSAGAVLALRLADDRDVEAPRDPPEHVAAPPKAGIEHAGLGRHAGRSSPPPRTGRPRPWRPCCSRPAASRSGRPERRRARRPGSPDRTRRRCRSTCAPNVPGDRDRIVGREVLRPAAGEIDDDVLDHGSTSSTVPAASQHRDQLRRLRCAACGALHHFFWPSGARIA